MQWDSSPFDSADFSLKFCIDVIFASFAVLLDYGQREQDTTVKRIAFKHSKIYFSFVACVRKIYAYSLRLP